jgi:nucleoside-diphosphate-sugar epimerase
MTILVTGATGNVGRHLVDQRCARPSTDPEPGVCKYAGWYGGTLDDGPGVHPAFYMGEAIQ